MLCNVHVRSQKMVERSIQGGNDAQATCWLCLLRYHRTNFRSVSEITVMSVMTCSSALYRTRMVNMRSELTSTAFSLLFVHPHFADTDGRTVIAV